jgi:hypothetical protein
MIAAGQLPSSGVAEHESTTQCASVCHSHPAAPARLVPLVSQQALDTTTTTKHIFSPISYCRSIHGLKALPIQSLELDRHLVGALHQNDHCAAGPVRAPTLQSIQASMDPRRLLESQAMLCSSSGLLRQGQLDRVMQVCKGRSRSMTQMTQIMAGSVYRYKRCLTLFWSVLCR